MGKMDELAEKAGWRKAPGRPEGVTEASEVYVKPHGGAGVPAAATAAAAK